VLKINPDARGDFSNKSGAIRIPADAPGISEQIALLGSGRTAPASRDLGVDWPRGVRDSRDAAIAELDIEPRTGAHSRR
jgi:hypothetical protein